MSDSLTALASENLNPSLRSLLEDVQRGHIRVPRFQRPFVWTNEQRLELLRSVRDNMPIGSLLVWRTIKYKLETFINVGPHQIPKFPKQAPTTGWQYLLDGHQRVSTLLGLLLPPTAQSESSYTSDEDEIDWDVQYDLSDEEFVFYSRIRRKGIQRPLLPLWTLFDGRMVNKHLRELRRLGEDAGWTEESLDLWESRADQLSYRFQQCRVPIVVMVTDDLDLAAKTFQRINSLGTPMSEAHLVAALTWRPDFDLRDRIYEVRETLPIGWRDFEDDIFLNICKGLSGLDMTKAAQAGLVKAIVGDTVLLSNAAEGLRRAIKLLSDRANVVRAELLPYALQVVLLAVELAPNAKSVSSDEELMQWFWRTSWSEVFGSSSYRLIVAEQENLRHQDLLGQPNWYRDALPARFDFRSARVRLFTLRLAMRRFFNDEHEKIEGRNLLEEFGRDSLIRLIPVPRDASPNLKQLLQGNGNRFLVNPGSSGELLYYIYNSNNISKEFLDAHFMDHKLLKTLRYGRLEEFLTRRAMRMEEWDKEEWRKECPEDSRLHDTSAVAAHINQRDRSRINVHEKWEVSYWTKELGVTREQLEQAISEAGSSVTAIKARLALPRKNP